jgi:hypothetical protein
MESYGAAWPATYAAITQAAPDVSEEMSYTSPLQKAIAESKSLEYEQNVNIYSALNTVTKLHIS